MRHMITRPGADRRLSLRLTLLFIMSLMLTAVAAPPASAAAGTCSEEGNYEVCVTYGGPDGPDLLIAQKIKAKIDATATTPDSGDYIRVAMYQWFTDGYGTEIADSLVRASSNGVSVGVIIGPDARNEAVRTKLVNAGIDVKVCTKACMPDQNGEWHGAAHNKFFLIKKGATKLVLQTSANLSNWQAQHAQNLLISRDDPELFSAYVNYWHRMYAGSWTWDGVTWSDDDKSPYGTNDLSRAYFFPQYSKTPLVGVLKNVTECTTDNDRVWLEHSTFHPGSYSQAVIDQLNRLRGIGCDIKFIVQEETGRTELLNNGIPSTDISCDGWSHNKLLLIDAKYAGEWRKAVFVGSYNLTENSNYRANDTMLRVINGWVTNRYIEQFREMWTHPRACDAV
ncbi:hypothetical protein RKD28_004840 [Streptomyces sp. SAI-229]